MMSTSLAGGSTALADPPGIDDEFALDVKVVLATHPNGKLQCSTCNDGASACNSSIEPPLS